VLAIVAILLMVAAKMVVIAILKVVLVDDGNVHNKR
jgi:hypothetical protein